MADDEDHIRQLIRLYLVNEGFAVIEAATGREALGHCQQDNPDLVVLDIMMPDMDGWEVLKQVRKQKNTPVIMLTAKDAEVDKVLGLELGADDYVTKPFSPRELVSRVKAVLRRSDSTGGTVYRDERGEASTGGSTTESLSYPGLRIDRTSREVHAGDQIMSLPPKEFDLL